MSSPSCRIHLIAIQAVSKMFDLIVVICPSESHQPITNVLSFDSALTTYVLANRVQVLETDQKQEVHANFATTSHQLANVLK